jgi:hypothetical protein
LLKNMRHKQRSWQWWKPIIFNQMFKACVVLLISVICELWCTTQWQFKSSACCN